MGNFRPGVWFSVIVLLMLIALLTLGTWQWGKIVPKTKLIDQIQAGLTADPVSITLLPVSGDHAYKRVIVQGRFEQRPGLRLFGTDKMGRSGYHHYGLLRTTSGAEIITSVGWTPFDQDEPFSDWPQSGTFTGVLLPEGAKGSFTPDNDMWGNVWYWADLMVMGQVLGAGEIYPYRLILDRHQGAPITPASPLGGQVLVDIPNDHFEYALTWYGLALTLVGVYIFFGYRRR